jgi:excisionase family DNA binding protein
MDRLTVTEAAEALGISQDAIYKRIQRGTIEHDKDSEGRVYVYLDTSDIEADKSTDASTDTSELKSELVAELRSHNDYLRHQLEVWQEEARRKDHIIAALTERIPELEPASEPRESPVTATESAGEGEPLDGEGRRSWWRRFLDL